MYKKSILMCTNAEKRLCDDLIIYLLHRHFDQQELRISVSRNR